MDGPSVFLSPLAEAKFSEDIWFNYHIPDTQDVTDETQSSLLIWNPGKRIFLLFVLLSFFFSGHLLVLTIPLSPSCL